MKARFMVMVAVVTATFMVAIPVESAQAEQCSVCVFTEEEVGTVN